MASSSGHSEAAAAEALSDLFFASQKLTKEEESRANTLRRKYRSWRSSKEGVGPVSIDVLDLQHEAIADEKRGSAKMKRVKTVGARMDETRQV